MSILEKRCRFRASGASMCCGVGDGETGKVDNWDTFGSCSFVAGTTLFLRLITDFFMATGRCTPWSL